VMTTGVVQKKYYRRSNRSTKIRKFYTAGNEADGRWVEEATTTTMSNQEEVYGHSHIEWETSLQQEVDEDSDATLVMEDEPELDTYSKSEKGDEESVAMVLMKGDAERNTYSPSGDETNVKSGVLREDMEKCNTVRKQDETYL
jgi:hypothetical protein